MSRRFSTALVDLDGTLSESEPGIVGSLMEAMTLADVPVPDRDILRSVIGPPFATGLPAVGVPAERLDDVIAHYRRIYNGGGMYDTALYPGVVEMLDGLRQAGIVIVLATSKPEDAAVPIVEHLGLRGHFAALAGADLALDRKGKGEVIAHALTLLGRTGPGPFPDIVMIGDREHDIVGAREHGIDTIAVEWGYGSPAEHTAFGAWATAATPTDVVELVLSTTAA